MFKTIKEALNFIESQRMKRSFQEFQEIIKRYHIPVDLKKCYSCSRNKWKRVNCDFY